MQTIRQLWKLQFTLGDLLLLAGVYWLVIAKPWQASAYVFITNGFWAMLRYWLVGTP